MATGLHHEAIGPELRRAPARSGFRRVPRSFWWALGISSVIVLAIALFLAWFNWNMLRGPIARQASAMTGRQVRLDGNLAVHLWSSTPSATIDGLKIGNPTWMKGGDVADIDRLTVSVKFWPLLVGRVELPLVQVEHPTLALYRDGAGRDNWQLGHATQPVKAPPIQHFVIDNGHLNYVDKKRGLVIVATMQSSETTGGQGTFHLDGKGSINRDPFLVTVTGASLMNVRHDRPYPFSADIRAGDTHVIAKGELPRPFDFGQIRTALDVSGGNLANIYLLTGLALPSSPPYRLSGELVRNGTSFNFHNVVGRVGASDLEGVFKVDRDADDRAGPARRPALAPAAPRRPGLADRRAHSAIAKTPQQVADAARLKAEGRLLPDAQLNMTRVRAMDAVVHYRAASVLAGRLPLRSFSLDLTLDHGVLAADPVSFSLPHGDLTAHIRVDARRDTPLTDLDARVVNLRMEDFLHNAGPPALEGLVEARAKLHGAGGSVHDAASSADGSLTVIAPHAEIRKAMAELLGVDVIKGLGLFLAKDQSETGRALRRGRLPGPPRRAHRPHPGAGHRSGAGHRQGLRRHAHGDHQRGPAGASENVPAVPHQGADHPDRPDPLAEDRREGRRGRRPGGRRGGAGRLPRPVAAILPFVDAGLTKNADCAGLTAQAQAQGAPVKAAAHAR